MGETPCGFCDGVSEVGFVDSGSVVGVVADNGETPARDRRARASCVRSARPIPDTHAPRMTARTVRNDTGNPENGVRITKIPRRISVLLRDIR